jgi:hypothetical protein
MRWLGHYGDDVYDLLSSSFEDPSATIVYPYVYRILNSSTRIGADAPPANGARDDATSPAPDHRPISPPRTASTASFDHRRSASPARNSQASSSANGHGLHGPSPTPAATSETDPDEQLMTIINHISSEKTGAMHKEGITELHQFLKAYPHKQARVDKLLESTGTAFRKYITRALATRAAEDQERDAAVSHTLLSELSLRNCDVHRSLCFRTRRCKSRSDTSVTETIKSVIGCTAISTFSHTCDTGARGRRPIVTSAQHLSVSSNFKSCRRIVTSYNIGTSCIIHMYT